MMPPVPVDAFEQALPSKGLMRTLGATLGQVTLGQVEIVLVPKPEVSQQHGFVHAGAISAIADSAAGYAALSLMPMDRGVLTTEFKIDLLAPAAGERIVARGKVVKAGRTLTLSSNCDLNGDRRPGRHRGLFMSFWAHAGEQRAPGLARYILPEARVAQPHCVRLAKVRFIGSGAAAEVRTCNLQRIRRVLAPISPQVALLKGTLAAYPKVEATWPAAEINNN